MDAVQNLRGHGITIFLLEKGELKAQETFDELTQANERFRAMAVGQ